MLPFAVAYLIFPRRPRDYQDGKLCSRADFVTAPSNGEGPKSGGNAGGPI